MDNDTDYRQSVEYEIGKALTHDKSIIEQIKEIL